MAKKSMDWINDPAPRWPRAPEYEQSGGCASRACVMLIVAVLIGWVLSSGCAARTDVQLDNASTLAGFKAEVLAEVENQFDIALKKLQQNARGGSDNTSQNAGGNAVNISPEIVVSGGAGAVIVCVIVVGLVVAVRRRESALNVITRQIDHQNLRSVQDTIEDAAVAAGIEPWLNKAIKRRRRRDERCRKRNDDN